MPAFMDDFRPNAHKLNQRTIQVCLLNLCTSDKKSSHKIRHKGISKIHFLQEDSTMLYVSFGNYFERPTAEEIGEIITKE